jgi:hypothetical protein
MLALPSGAGMSDPRDANDKARTKAQSHFTQSEQRDKLIKQEIEKERAATDAKTAKLRALRLAKEAAEKEAADKVAAEKVANAKTAPKRKRAVKQP